MTNFLQKWWRCQLLNVHSKRSSKRSRLVRRQSIQEMLVQRAVNQAKLLAPTNQAQDVHVPTRFRPRIWRGNATGVAVPSMVPRNAHTSRQHAGHATKSGTLKRCVSRHSSLNQRGGGEASLEATDQNLEHKDKWVEITDFISLWFRERCSFERGVSGWRNLFSFSFYRVSQILWGIFKACQIQPVNFTAGCST